MGSYQYTGEDSEGVKRSGFMPGPPFQFAIAWLDAGGHWLCICDATGTVVAGVEHFGSGHYEAWTLS